MLIGQIVWTIFVLVDFVSKYNIGLYTRNEDYYKPEVEPDITLKKIYRLKNHVHLFF